MHARRTDTIGLTGSFRIGDRAAVEWLLDELTRVGLRRVRADVSWPAWRTPEGRRWYDWLLPRLGTHTELLPCFTDTPAGLGLGPGRNAPLREPRAYADWLDEVVDRHGAFFEHVLIWRAPGTPAGWDTSRDPHHHVLRAMVGRAARRLRDQGKRPVLGGGPADPSWLGPLHAGGALRDLAAVTVLDTPHADAAAATRSWLRARGLSADVWAFAEAPRCAADRIYLPCREPAVVA